MVLFEQSTFARLHPSLLAFLGMVVPENVQDSVSDKKRHFVVKSTRMVGRLSLSHCGTQNDIAEEKRMIVSVGLRTVGPAR